MSLRLLGVAATTAAALFIAPVPFAAAQGCPDVEVVFARGTCEPPGVGGVGQAFVDAVRAQAAPRVGQRVSGQLRGQQRLHGRPHRVRQDSGRRDPRCGHCTSRRPPRTVRTPGSCSAGSRRAQRWRAYVTSAEIPEQVPAEYPRVHPESDALGGGRPRRRRGPHRTPSPEFLANIGAPPITIGPSYVDKTLKVCAPDDNICNGSPAGPPSFAHAMYGVNGATNDAAAYAVARLSPGSNPPPAPVPAPAAAIPATTP